MKENPSSGDHESRVPFAALPLSILTWVESKIIQSQYRELQKQSAVQDAWYLSDGAEITGPEKLADIRKRLLKGETGFAILHQSEERQAAPPWRQLSYRAWSLDPLLTTVWILLFWFLILLAGWIAISLIIPVKLRLWLEIAYLIALVAFASGAFSRRTRPARDGFPQESPVPDE